METVPETFLQPDGLPDGSASISSGESDLCERRRVERELLDVSEWEKQRFGEDLHDGLCQQLAGIAFLAQAIERLANGNPSACGGKAANIALLLQDAVRHAKGMVRELHPVSSLPTGLSVALANLAADTESRSQIKCAFRQTCSIELRDPSVATHAYRIAHDAIADAICNGHARHVDIVLSRAIGRVQLRIVDDGSGGPDARRFPDPVVLRMMRHRAAAVFGSLTITPFPRGGVQMVCEFAG